MREYERQPDLNVAIWNTVINHVKGLRVMYEVRLANLKKISPSLRWYLTYCPQGNLRHFNRMQDNPLDYRNGESPNQAEEPAKEAQENEFLVIDKELAHYIFDNQYFKVLRQYPVTLPQLRSTPCEITYTINVKYLREKYKDFADSEGNILVVVVSKVSYGRKVNSYVIRSGITMEAKSVTTQHTVCVRINPIQA
jgi:hypothetical protein